MNNKFMLSKAFYDIEKIQQAIQAYKKLATIAFVEDKDYYIYSIESSAYDSELVAKEFENYILGLMNS